MPCPSTEDSRRENIENTRSRCSSGDSGAVVGHADPYPRSGGSGLDAHHRRDPGPGELHRVADQVQQDRVDLVGVTADPGELTPLHPGAGGAEHGLAVGHDLVDQDGEVHPGHPQGPAGLVQPQQALDQPAHPVHRPQ